MKVALQFVAMGLIWGASFLFMKIALDGVSFGQVAWARLVFGAITLGVIVLVMRSRLPREPIVWLHFTVVAITYCVVPFLLFAWAEQYVSSSLASIYNAVTPITTAILVTVAFRVEKLNRDQVLGVLIGVVGVVVVVGPWSVAALTGSLWGQLACLGAVTCYGFSFGYIRRFISHRAIPATTTAFLNIGIAAVIMLVLTPFVALGPITFSWPVLLSLLALGMLGTGVVYIWNMNVLRAWGPTATSGVTYVTPVVGVALGILVLGEHLSWNEPVGALIVIAGILLTQQRVRIFSRRQAELVGQRSA
ncbi:MULTISPECIES: DMT family transporter [Leifsonia]|uniref:Drug/metabolite transporter (DMT)-like permease n=3 Tax=Leifsonia TaxID=110932 RepID=A0A7W4YL67_LEIAQ|nr:DMT family transporter [Leifsonia aquatica]ERK70151.1 putative membrane protein [Leifsonia aquatica ATCC 14665]MBB2968750.1 drug/metabolite transporter (DMT)-like permease [Leifsonia aquatica]NYK10303.1 drug/metabolite transporter (DMT)-like permease [Leifsonia naganoensis]